MEFYVDNFYLGGGFSLFQSYYALNYIIRRRSVPKAALTPASERMWMKNEIDNGATAAASGGSTGGTFIPPTSFRLCRRCSKRKHQSSRCSDFLPFVFPLYQNERAAHLTLSHARIFNCNFKNVSPYNFLKYYILWRQSIDNS